MLKNIILIPLIFFTSCIDNQKMEITLLSEKVMAVHDEVMPKMTELHKVKKMLKDQLGKIDSNHVFDAIKKIDDADEAMMVWMDEYRPQIDTLSLQDQKQYLNLEMEKIIKVKEMMLKSLENASNLLNHESNK